jgi:hypothetical protein
MSSRFRILTVLGIVSATQLVIVDSAQADQTSGILTGRVTDTKTGQPLRDVAIVVTSNSLQGEQSVVTDESGFYRIPHLPAGVYNVQMFRGEYKPFERTGVRLSAGQSILVNGAMVPSSSGDIDLVVEVPQIDTGSSQTGVNLGSDFLRRVPLVPPTGNGGAVRSFEAVANAAPGVVNDRYGASLAGTTSPENNFMVNGIVTRNTISGINGSPLSIEFMDEVQVITGSYMPEYGLNTGGTISASVKRGSNEFHGHVWANLTPGALVGTRKEVVRNNSTFRNREALVWLGDVGGDLGGPIIKDKLWFYTGVMLGKTQIDLKRTLQAFTQNPMNLDDYLIDEETGDYVATVIPGSTRTFKAEGSTLQAVLNLTFAINPDSKIDLFASTMPAWQGGEKAYQADPTAGRPALANSLGGTLSANSGKVLNLPVDAALRWTVDADNKRWTFEQSAAWHHETINFAAIDGSVLGDSTGLASQPLMQWNRTHAPGLGRRYHSLQDFEPTGVPAQCAIVPGSDPEAPGLPLCPVNGYFTGGPGVASNTKQNSLQLKQSTTRIFSAAGHHELKFGANYSLDTFENNKGYSGGVWYRETRGGGQMQMWRGFGYLTGPDQPVFLPELNFTTKLHTGRAYLQDGWSIMDKVTLNVGVLYDNQTVIGGMGNVALGLYQQFSPRLGLVWDPMQNGRTKIRAAAGRYFQAISLDLADRAGTPEPSLQAFWDVGAGTPCGEFGNVKSLCTDTSSLRPDFFGTYPSRRFYPIGATRVPIDRKIKAPAKDELSLGADWEFIHDYTIGVDLIWHKLVRAMEDMSRDQGNTYFIGNPGYGIAGDFPKATRDYKAFIVRFDKKLSNHWAVNANYTLSKLEGNYNGLFRNETGQLDPNITSDFDLISLLANRTGALEADRRHNFKLFASGDIPLGERWGIDLGAGFTGVSGGPTNYLGAHDLYGPNESFLLPRGSGERLPWVFNINARGGIAFALSKSSRVSFGIDAFNVFNFQQATTIDPSYSLDASLKPSKNKADLEEQIRTHYVDALFEQALAAETEALGGMVPDENWQMAKRAELDAGTTKEAALKDSGIVEKNYGQYNTFQQPRQVTFSLRFSF